MVKKIAIPVNDLGILDAHFGHCKFFHIFDVKDGQIVSDEMIVPPAHEPGLLPKWLAERNVTDIVAGGMGQRAIVLFNERGVNAFVGAPSITGKELVAGFLDGSLSFSANYCDH